MKGSQQAPPVSEGDEVDVKIESIGDKGDGVARVQGFVVFVSGVAKGDWVQIKIKKVLASVAFADKIKSIEAPPMSEQQRQRGPSPKRQDAFAEIDLENLGEGSDDFGEEL